MLTKLIIAVVFAVLLPLSAPAQTVIAGPTTVTRVDDAGRFTVEKTATVFDDGGGIFRYSYVIKSLSGDPICGFKLNIASTSILSASFVGGSGNVEPQTITVGATQTEFKFDDATAPLNCMATFAPFPGDTSAPLEITSTLLPGMGTDFITVSINSFFASDEPG